MSIDLSCAQSSAIFGYYLLLKEEICRVKKFCFCSGKDMPNHLCNYIFATWQVNESVLKKMPEGWKCGSCRR